MWEHIYELFNDSLRLSLKGITSTNWNLNCRKIAEV